MIGRPTAERCYRCHRPRPTEPWVLGLDVLADGQRIGWLCADCERIGGEAWNFVDTVTASRPDAEFASTVACANLVISSPLVLPRLSTGEWANLSPFATGPA
jgi:hypothetical protein